MIEASKVKPMKFTLQLPTDQVTPENEFTTAPAIAEMACAAEAAGFAAVFVTDHPAPSERWLRAGGHHSLDPFVALACVAGATQTLRLQTHVLVAGYRNPFLVAKAVATLDRVSQGRVIVGLASGYLRAEFEALGAAYEERNPLADEQLALLEKIWSGEVVTEEGLHFRASGNRALPRPVQAPRPPLWVGGNAPRAMRRAVAHADGWLPFPANALLAKHSGTRRLESEDDLRVALESARAYASEIGRTRALDVCFTPLPPYSIFKTFTPAHADALCETIARYRALGVTWTATLLACETRAEFLDRVAWYGERVIARVGV